MLKFSPLKHNSKLYRLRNGYSFSMLAGVACPGAKECKSQVVTSTNNTRTIQDGKHTLFRCFSASQEVLFKNVYLQRKHNLDKLTSVANNKSAMVEMISNSIPKRCGVVRLHVSGDFFNQVYFDAWLEVCKDNPHILFYAYTKSLNFWVRRLDQIPSNLVLTASHGGHYDNLIEKYGLISAKVVGTAYEAKKLGLPVDTTDKYAIRSTNRKSFALLAHGPQKKGTRLAKLWRAQMAGKRAKTGYSMKSTWNKGASLV